MSGDDQISIAIYERFPEIHHHITQNVLTLSLDPETLNVTPNSRHLHDRLILVKEALWALSNIAAAPPIVNHTLIEDNTL